MAVRYNHVAAMVCRTKSQLIQKERESTLGQRLKKSKGCARVRMSTLTQGCAFSEECNFSCRKIARKGEGTHKNRNYRKVNDQSKVDSSSPPQNQGILREKLIFCHFVIIISRNLCKSLGHEPKLTCWKFTITHTYLIPLHFVKQHMQKY